MYLLKYLFYTVISILISIGDFVLFLGENIKVLKVFSRRKQKKIESILAQEERKNQRKADSALKGIKSSSHSLGAFFKRFFKSIGKTIRFIFLFILTLFYIPFAFLVKAFSQIFKIKIKIPKLPKLSIKGKKHQKAEVVAVPAERRTYNKPKGLWRTKIKFLFFGIIVSFVFGFLPLLSLIFITELPNPENISVNYIPKTTKIYDKNGNLLYEIFANQNRSIVHLADLPLYLRQATIAIEDKDFYKHPGFDIRGIARAFVSTVFKKEIQGGSTITQQLIKSAFFSPEPALSRKVKEVVLAFWAEKLYTKDQILELYFNYVPYGGTAWGVGSASEIYFGKDVSDLTLAESAFLGGLPRAPSAYSPFVTQNNWKKRQIEVLDAMVRDHYITRKQADEAEKENIVFRAQDVPIKAPHFVMYVRDLLIQKYGISEVERGGLQVTTTLDLPTQTTVEGIVRDEVAQDAYLNIKNGASLVLNPSNGDVLAMVGSKNYFDREAGGNVNVVTALRQPGSTIKLVTYALALSSGYTEATILDDTPFVLKNQWETYAPVNYDGKFHGRVPLRTAFANSFNIPPVRLVQKLGVDQVVDMGRKMGISTWGDSSRYGLSITLGGAEVKMLDLATAYSVIANKGQKADVDPILSIKDSYGNVIYKKPNTQKRVLDEGVAFIISDILADNKARSIEFGLTSPLNVANHRVSVKTGTTDNKRDNWTVGFTNKVLVATWVGNNDNTPMSQALASGITGAAPMWNKIMSTMLAGTVDEPVVQPANILKKFCIGQDRYFVRGTENSVSCAALPTPSVSVTPGQ